MYKVGDMAVYPAQGVGVVEAIESRDFGGETHDFYILRIVDSDTTVDGSNAAVKIVAHDNVLPRMSSLKNTAWPTETFIAADKEFFFNGEAVSMRHVPATLPQWKRLSPKAQP